MLPERLGRTARVLSTATELTPNGYQQTRLEGDLDHPAHPLFGVSHFGPCGWINCAIRVFQLDLHTMLVSDPFLVVIVGLVIGKEIFRLYCRVFQS